MIQKMWKVICCVCGISFKTALDPKGKNISKKAFCSEECWFKGE
jgi:hypothetical protein